MRHLIRTLLLLMLVCHTAIAKAVDVNSGLPVHIAMKDSGYTMGDYIKMHVEIPTKNKLSIDPESLPLIGRVKPWLDLHDLKVDSQKDKTSLTFTWQIFATVEIAQALKTPQIIIKSLDDPKQSIVIPAQRFYYSPVLPYPIGEVKRHHNIPPPAFDVYTPLTLMGICLAIATILGLFLLWVKDLLPWLPYQPGPIAALARQLKGFNNDVLQHKQLQQIHHALNRAAKQSLYPSTLNTLFTEATYLESEREAIHQFFNDSWRSIYENTSTAPITVAQTLAWVSRSAIAERIYRKRAMPVKSLTKN